MKIKLTCLHASAVTTQAQRKQNKEKVQVEETALDIHKVSITVMADVLPMWKLLYYNLDRLKELKKKKITHTEQYLREKQRHQHPKVLRLNCQKNSSLFACIN